MIGTPKKCLSRGWRNCSPKFNSSSSLRSMIGFPLKKGCTFQRIVLSASFARSSSPHRTLAFQEVIEARPFVICSSITRGMRPWATNSSDVKAIPVNSVDMSACPDNRIMRGVQDKCWSNLSRRNSAASLGCRSSLQDFVYWLNNGFGGVALASASTISYHVFFSVLLNHRAGIALWFAVSASG